MTGQLYFANRDDWRVWLEKNHATEKEAWLAHYKKHTGKPGIPYEDAVEEALCFGWIDGLLRSIDSEKYALRYTPRRKNSIWSETNKKRVERMIQQGRMTEAGLAKIRQAQENGEWRKAESRERLVVPPDLKKALAANKEAGRNFKGLAPSRQKQFIWWVTSAKKKETRQRRINEILRMVKGNGDGSPG
ncbi:YdeI family protein [Chloroflexota bacterium]